MTSINSLIEKYVAQEQLSANYKTFCQTINKTAPKQGTSVDLGAQYDVFHGLLLGGDEHIMIDVVYDEHSPKEITDLLETLEVPHGTPEKTEQGHTIHYSLEGDKQLTIIAGDAANYTHLDKEYSGILVKGPRQNNATDIRNIAHNYTLSRGGVLVCSRTMSPDLTEVARGHLLFEHLGREKALLSEHILYRKNHE